jgi:hypothetical protein
LRNVRIAPRDRQAASRAKGEQGRETRGERESQGDRERSRFPGVRLSQASGRRCQGRRVVQRVRIRRRRAFQRARRRKSTARYDVARAIAENVS